MDAQSEEAELRAAVAAHPLPAPVATDPLHAFVRRIYDSGFDRAECVFVGQAVSSAYGLEGMRAVFYGATQFSPLGAHSELATALAVARVKLSLAWDNIGDWRD